MAGLVKCKTCTNKGDPNDAKTCSSCGDVLIKTWIENKIDKITPEKLAKWFLGMIVVVILLVAGVFGGYFTFFDDGFSLENTDWGTFGDFIGGTLNPILSFLSLIALLCTIVLQSKELELTRDELKRSASAQEATKDILDKQSETLARQQFESTFFSLLDQHNKALEQITNNSIRGQLTSQEDMNVLTDTKYLISAPISAIKFIYLRILMSKGYGSRDLVSAKKTLEEYNSHCGHYFRVLYQLLKFIAISAPGGTIGPDFTAEKIQNEKLSDDEKMYSNIVRSFLGYEITQLLSINCYCTDESDTYWKYRLLIERYSFLEHMPLTVNNRGTHEILVEVNKGYKRSAFDNSNFAKKYE